jgi:hypothetical protein
MQRNPFYAVSAATMLVGCLMLSEALETQPGQLHGVLVTIGVLQLYESLLIALGAFLVRSKRAVGDGVTVLALESAFLLDVTLLGTECVTVELGVGSAVAAAALALAIVKLRLVRRYVPEVVPGRTAHLLGDHAALVFALPVAAGCLARARLFQPLPLYGLWWLAFPLALLARDLDRQAPDGDGNDSPARRVWIWLPTASVLIHLIALGWVHSLRWQAGLAAPFLLGLVASCRRENVRRMIVLTLTAIGVSSGQVFGLLLPGGGEVSVSAFRGAVHATVLAGLILAWRLRVWPLAAASVALFLAFQASSAQSVPEALTELGRLLVPRTLMAWGILLVAASFVALMIGARRSLKGLAPPTSGPGAEPGPEDGALPSRPAAPRPPITSPGTDTGRIVRLIAVAAVGGLVLAFCFLSSVGHCVVEGTAIDTPDGPRPAESLRVGDAVWTRGAAGLEDGRIIRLSRHLAWNHLALALSDGRVLRITPNHPIQTHAGWREAGGIRAGDMVELVDALESVNRVMDVSGPVFVYDLSVEPNETFFAGGVLVHNKRAFTSEAATVGDIRTVISAEAGYEEAAGSYGRLDCLLTPSSVGCIQGYAPTAPTFLDEAIATLAVKSGYRRRFVPGRPQPADRAEPWRRRELLLLGHADEPTGRCPRLRRRPVRTDLRRR